MRNLLVAAVLLLSALLARAALAGSSRLLLVDPDPELAAAIDASLQAWGTVVVLERSSGPGNTMPGSAEEARTRAATHRAGAVIWISRADDGVALWIYDATNDRVLARRLATPPPFDDATAASVALIVKTMLRHSEVPPEAERAEVVARADHVWLRASLQAGLRANATRPSWAELRLGLGASVWPVSAGGASFGLGLELGSGPGVDVSGPTFTGHWSETSLLLAAHVRLQLSDSFDLTIIPGAGLDISSMSGVVSEPRDDVESTRVNALAALHSELGLQASPALRTALRLGVSVPSHTQTYLVHGEPVFGVNDPMLTALLVMEASLF